MTEQTNPPTPSEPPKAKQTMLKVISLCSNFAILANLAVGFFAVGIFMIPVFAGIHAVLRMNYLKIETALQTQDPNQTQTAIAPPMVRNIASVITAIILSLVLYWLGFGVAKLAGQF